MPCKSCWCAQAFNLARRDRPDLVLTDLHMPVFNGFEVARMLASEPATAAIPVLMMSETLRPADRLWGQRPGARGFLEKPVRHDELLFKVRNVLQAARRMQSPAAGDSAVRPGLPD